MFIEYVHFVSEDYDIALSSHCPPSRFIVTVELGSVLLDNKRNNSLPVYRPVIARRNNQIAGPEEVPHCLAGIRAWNPVGKYLRFCSPSTRTAKCFKCGNFGFKSLVGMPVP
jgi:hypothetical protein